MDQRRPRWLRQGRGAAQHHGRIIRRGSSGGSTVTTPELFPVAAAAVCVDRRSHARTGIDIAAAQRAEGCCARTGYAPPRLLGNKRFRRHEPKRDERTQIAGARAGNYDVNPKQPSADWVRGKTRISYHQVIDKDGTVRVIQEIEGGEWVQLKSSRRIPKRLLPSVFEHVRLAYEKFTVT